MREYSGLCVGGPLAGRRYVARDESLWAEAPQPRLSIKNIGPTAIPKKLSVKRVLYTWRWLDGCGIWIAEGMTPREAVEELMFAYENATAQ